MLNSSVTHFAVDLYKPFLGKRLSEETVIRHSKRAGVVLVFLTMFFAPFLMHFQDGIFSYMVKTYVVLSPWGLVKDTTDKQINYWFIAAWLAMCVVIFGLPLKIYLRSRALEKVQKLNLN